jgi:probable F420-dependent oxidoreductase
VFLLDEVAGLMGVPGPDRHYVTSPRPDLVVRVAQLRGVLPAQQSAEVTQEDEHRRTGREPVCEARRHDGRVRQLELRERFEVHECRVLDRALTMCPKFGRRIRPSSRSPRRRSNGRHRRAGSRYPARVDLPLDDALRVGFITGVASRSGARGVAELAERHGFDSVWTGDHVAFPVPILDAFQQLAQIAAHAEHLTLGTSVFLLPLRHPVLAAKQVASLDHLCDGRFVFGVGIGGEFPGEYAACEVPHGERGARLSAALPIVRALVRGEPAKGDGRFYHFPETVLAPAARQPEGPPIWCGGRAEAALRRIGRLADGWISYVVTPERFAEGLATITAAAREAGRRFERFGTSHLLFTRIDDDHERALDAATAHLSKRYAMDFRSAARRYAALGSPADVAAKVGAFRAAGVRHLILDMTGPLEDRDAQLQRFAEEVRPLL